MFLQSLPLVFVLAGLVLYTVLGGADFGAGFWQLIAGRGVRAEEIREQAHRSIGPVWEANHVWLIFVLTVFWTSYPRAFESIASTLAVPLFIALVGILFRGAAYGLRAGASNPRESARIDTLFSLSSVLVPFALGAAIGAIAANRVPVGNARGDLFSSWLNGTSIIIGGLAVANCAYLASVYLAADAHHRGRGAVEEAFRLRALAAGALAGVFAIGGIFLIDSQDGALYRSLTHGGALAGVIASGLAGVATLICVYSRRYVVARFTAATAVAAVIVAWAVARWPTILPGLSVYRAAASHDTLVWVVSVVLGGAIILFPSLALLFRLATTGTLEESSAASALPRMAVRGRIRHAPLPRIAAALLTAAVGFLTIADAQWAHAVGVVALFGFVATGFLAVSLSLVARDAQ